MTLEEARKFENTEPDRRARLKVAMELLEQSQELIGIASRLFGPRSGDATVWDFPEFPTRPKHERTPGI